MEEQLNEVQSLQEENQKIKQLIEERKQLIAQKTEMLSRDKMGGKTEFIPQPKKVELTPQEYAKQVLQGKIPAKE